jgi:hypothetical protein
MSVCSDGPDGEPASSDEWDGRRVWCKATGVYERSGGSLYVYRVLRPGEENEIDRGAKCIVHERAEWSQT